MLKYLVSRKFIKEKDTDENFKAELSDKEYCLTEEGKAYLSEYNYTYIQWILTTCLAVLALIVSIISLVITSLNS